MWRNKIRLIGWCALLLTVGIILVSCRDKDRCTNCSDALEPPLGIAFSVPLGDVHYFHVSPMRLAGLGRLPGWVVVAAEINENAHYLAVANEAIYHHIALLELPEMNVLKETAIGGVPLDIEMNASGQRIYVVTKNASFWIYNTADGSYDTLELMLQPRRFALRPPDKNEAWIVCGAGNSILVINLLLQTHVDTITLPQTPTDIRFSPDGLTYFVAMEGDTGKLAVYSTASQQLIRSKSVGRGAFELAISDDGRYAAASDSVGGKVHVWDTSNESLWSLQVGGYPYRIRFTKRSHEFYVLLLSQSRILHVRIHEHGPVADDVLTVPPTATEFVLWETPQ